MLFGGSVAILNGDDLSLDGTGDRRIAAIMANPVTGVEAYNKARLKFVQSVNLEKDLNIKEIAHSFGCQTQMGETFLAETLRMPISPLDQSGILQSRQEFVKQLVEDKQLKVQVEELINVLREAEEGVSELFSDNFIGKVCPELVELQKLKVSNPWMYSLLSNFQASFVQQTVTAGLKGASVYFLAKSAIDFGKIMAAGGCSAGENALLGFITGYYILVDASVAYSIWNDYTTASKKRALMHNLNTIVLTADKLERLSAKYNLQSQFRVSQIQDAEGLELLKMLRHSRYRYKKLRMFYYPKVHSFMYQLYQQDHHLAKVFACVAELDVYNAIADTMIASRRKSANPFCFVKFIQQDQPAIKSKKFWNVLVDKAVVNDFTEKRQVILTGPNAGGKTTAIRSILQNIVLGQTFGVAAAEEFEFTQFDVIHSYLNISDDLINGSSLFASEVKRAKEIVKTIQDLQPVQKYFFVLDELFTGTVSEDGEICAYEFVNKIASAKRVLFIYATHFEKLKSLGHNLDYCANYQVGAPVKSEDGKLKYPFTFIPGASSSRVAIDMAKEAGLFA